MESYTRTKRKVKHVESSIAIKGQDAAPQKVKQQNEQAAKDSRRVAEKERTASEKKLGQVVS